MTELKPCPFCGGPGYGPLFSQELGAKDVYAVLCEDCGIDLEGESTMGTEAAKAAAVTKWNTRPGETMPEAVIEHRG